MGGPQLCWALLGDRHKCSLRRANLKNRRASSRPSVSLPMMLSIAIACSAAASSSFETVPVIDLSADRDVTVPPCVPLSRRLASSTPPNTCVPQTPIDQQFEQSKGLFALPPDAKAAMPFNGTLDIGYLGLGGQALDEESTSRDTKEGFMMANNGVFDAAFNLSVSDPLDGATLFWPPKDALPDYERVLREYTAQLTALNHKLNSLLFAALGLSEADRIALARQPFTVTKQLRYVPAEVRPSDQQDQAQIGAGAHADWGALTILATDGQPGLEVEHPDPKVGWVPVPPRDGCLIINAGDQITHWTNGALRSANHRVIVRPEARRPRYSTAFFTYFDLHALVAPLPQFVTPGEAAHAANRDDAGIFPFQADRVGGRRKVGGRRRAGRDAVRRGGGEPSASA